MTVRTVERREEEELLVQELEALTHLKHPNILLLMGRLKEPLPSELKFLNFHGHQAPPIHCEKSVPLWNLFLESPV